jgi:L-seryl-tRNA(Ser) seleniumtransferase
MTTPATTERSIYRELGARPVINARGHATVLGGSTPSPRVRAAMEAAERDYVDMQELLERCGQLIAGLLAAEAAYVTPGAAAAMALGTAACITGPDTDKMARLPDVRGLPDTVLIQAPHRYPYDRVPTIVGPKLHVVGDPQGTTRAHLAAALGPHVAHVLYPVHLEGVPGTLDLAEVVEVAHGQGAAVLADAAGQVYPLARAKRFGPLGVDLFAFGGKYFGGPNSTGILAGRRDLIQAAAAQGFIGFETVSQGQAFGRPLKLDRQEVVGLTVALQEWMEMDHEARVAALERRVRAMGGLLEGLPGTTLDYPRDVPTEPRTLVLRIDPGRARRSAGAVRRALREGDPSIVAGVGPEGPETVLINPITMREEQDAVVAERLRALLTH